MTTPEPSVGEAPPLTGALSHVALAYAHVRNMDERGGLVTDKLQSRLSFLWGTITDLLPVSERLPAQKQAIANQEHVGRSYRGLAREQFLFFHHVEEAQRHLLDPRLDGVAEETREFMVDFQALAAQWAADPPTPVSAATRVLDLKTHLPYRSLGTLAAGAALRPAGFRPGGRKWRP